MDPETGVYNTPYLVEGLTLVPGYGRMQGVVFRRDDPRFAGLPIGRRGDGGRGGGPGLPDGEPQRRQRHARADRSAAGRGEAGGILHQAKSHNAVAVAVAQDRADWGMAIDTVARQYGLGFLPVQTERYDFVVPASRAGRPAVRRFVDLLRGETGQRLLRELGFDPAAV